MAPTEWIVDFHPACREWAEGLSEDDQIALQAAIVVLREQGPTLGRPLVDRIKGSKTANLKELRPPSTGRSEIRVLFAFDLVRKAIFLVGGDKSGKWVSWYKVNIPIAEQRFNEHQAALTVKKGKNEQK